MERLTERKSDFYDLIKMNDKWHTVYYSNQPEEKRKDCVIYEAIQILAEYEDTGLTPEVCRNYKIFEDDCISKGVTFKEILKYIEGRDWIPCNERLPTTDGKFEVTVKGSKGKRRVEMCSFYKNANGGRGKWGDGWDCINVMAWRSRSKPYEGK